MAMLHALRALVLALAFAGAACAQPEAARSEAGAALEVVTVETQTGPVRFQVEIADDEEERAQGLMFRETMASDHGMLFQFQEPERASFWMRNTPLSLDIIFIGPDGRILNIAERTTPYSEAPVPSVGLTRGVLEINGGRAAELGIRPGDRVRHRIFSRGG